jgi:Zn-dependent protease
LQPNSFLVLVFEFVVLLFSLSFHECAHAWTASRLGDQTARMMGRVSLNPMVHADPVGTFLLPALMLFGPYFGLSFFGGFLFGWAKPVPIISRNFRNFRRDDSLVSLAGPASNLLLAVLAFIGLAVLIVVQRHQPPMAAPSSIMEALFTLFSIGLQLNLTLAIFNLIPIPPLDGSHLLRHVLPYGAVQIYDSISGIGSYLLIIFAGRFILSAILHPVLGLAEQMLSAI